MESQIKMKILTPISFCALLLFAGHALSQAPKKGASPVDTQVKVNAANNPTQRDGQQVFDQNCSRCHNAPEGFSPRISGTVVRHMRVRAGLSAEDEKALLRFLNP
jgi:cytochrome c5